MPSLKGAVRRLTEASRAVVGLTHPAGTPPNPIHLWDDDVGFNRLFRLVESHTIVDKLRCFMLYQLARHVDSLEGDVAEVGVCRGGTAKLLAQTLGPVGKTLHLFDTFTGMPEADPAHDVHREGDFGNTSLEAVRGYLSDRERVEFLRRLDLLSIGRSVSCTWTPICTNLSGSAARFSSTGSSPEAYWCLMTTNFSHVPGRSARSTAFSRTIQKRSGTCQLDSAWPKSGQPGRPGDDVR